MDDDALSAVGSSVGGVALGSLAVCLTLSKACVCCLCNAKSTDPTPLTYQDEEQYGGARPWNKYRKKHDPETETWVKVPEGKLCLICFSTFRALGLHYKYANYGSYYKAITNKQEDHSTFLQAVKEYIQQKNASPGSRIDREAVKKATTTLHTENKTGVLLKGPKREFVMLDHWDTKLDGDLDESMVVEETWQGKKVKGVWRSKGRVGVLEANNYEDNSLRESTEEHSGQGPFAEQGLGTKKQVLQKVFAAAEEERQKHTVESAPGSALPQDVMDALRQVLPNIGGLTSGEPDTESAAGLVAVPSVEAVSEEEEGQDEEEEECPAARLAATVGAPKRQRPRPRPLPRLRPQRLRRRLLGKGPGQRQVQRALCPALRGSSPSRQVTRLPLQGTPYSSMAEESASRRTCLTLMTSWKSNCWTTTWS